MEKSINYTPLEETILIMTGMGNNIAHIIEAFPMIPADQNSKSTYDLKFTLHQLLLLEINKFIEEYPRLTKALKNENHEKIIKRLIPLIIPIMENKKEIRDIRNRNIAHPHRNRKGNFVPLIIYISKNKFSTNFAYHIFLGQCIRMCLTKLYEYLPNIYENAKEKYIIHTSKYVAIQEKRDKLQPGLDFFEKKFQKIINEIINNEKSIK